MQLTEPPVQNAFDPAASAQMECLVRDLGRLYQERNTAFQEISWAHHEALMRLSLAAELRDDDTGIHIVRIGYLAEELARLCGESVEYAAMLRHAAPMHDIGKIGIPDSILKKPGPLTAEERLVMNAHPGLGSQILGRSRVPLFQMSADVALAHHERWDGLGYPVGLAGDAIPLCGRIVAVVDFFDALTMDRVYRPAFHDSKALSMLREERGRAFDPRIVDAFLDNARRLIGLRDRINRCPPSFEELARGEVPGAANRLSG